MRVLVTAGGTREPIDAVRIITNRSSGKQGYAIAEAAARRGADVTLVTTIGRPGAVGRRDRAGADRGRDAGRGAWAGRPPPTSIVMAAAVADFRPKEPPDRKLKKHEGIPEIVLEPTHDFLVDLGRDKRAGQVLVGFAAETDDLVEHAAEKLRAQAPRPHRRQRRLRSPTPASRSTPTARSSSTPTAGVDALPLLAKSDLAGVILDKVARLLDAEEPSQRASKES